MLKVSTYDRTSITFGLATDSVNCTITNSRPRVGAEERGEPATAFDHPSDHWTHGRQ